MNRTFGAVTGLTNQPQGLDVGLAGASAPWINDWSAYQTVYDWSGTTTVSTPATSWGTLRNITGEGWLVFSQGFYGSGGVIPDVRITVDGVTYLFNGNATTTDGGNIVSRPIYFKTSLKIEVFNATATPGMPMGCDYTYLLKTGTPDTTKQSILRASSRTTDANETSSTTNTNIVNVTGAGYLLGVEFSGYYSTAVATVVATIVIDGVTKMSARQVFTIGSNGAVFHHFDGPIRFASSLVVQHHMDIAGSRALSKASYTLD